VGNLPYATIDQSFNMYFEVSGEGMPVIFIHPPAMGLVTFKKQKPLAEKYKVIVYDIRGNGHSGFTNEKITIPLLADDLRKLLDHLDIKKAVLCSYSSAASIALAFAIEFPERLHALIFSGGYPEVKSFLLAQQFRLGMLTARCNGIKLLAKAIAISHTKEKAFQREIYNYVLKVDPTILYQMYKAGLLFNCTERLSDITQPLLLIYGRKDDYIHKHYRLFERNMIKTETIFIDRAKHQIPTSNFIEFNKIIDHFLQKLPTISR